MIINGASRRNGAFFAKHLSNAEENERVTLTEMRGLAAMSMTGAFKEMQAVASGTQCLNYFYHAHINPRAHEQLTSAQWDEAVDTLEKNLGLARQPRFVVEHVKGGRTHRHVVWSRIDVARMRAISDSQDRAQCHTTARQLERAFGLERGTSRFDRNRDGVSRERGPASWETFRGKKSGLNPRDVKAEITSLWRRADSGQAFRAALETRGYVLARGDRRDFCVVDRAGHVHSLAKRIQGVRMAEVRARMVDVDGRTLPSVAEAGLLQKTRATERAAKIERAKAKRQARTTATLYDRADMVSIQQDAVRHLRLLQTSLASTPVGLEDTRTTPTSDPFAVVARELLDAKKTMLPTVEDTLPQRSRFHREQAVHDRTVALNRLLAMCEKGTPIQPEELGSLPEADLRIIAQRGEKGLRALLYAHVQPRGAVRDVGRER